MQTLSATVEQCITSFNSAAQSAFGDDLLSVVLYGSAADGAMRLTSDVNVLLVLRRFTPEAAGALREPMRLAHAAVQLKAMFLLDTEVDAAADAFAVKFGDIAARHRLLFGVDPFAQLKPARDAVLRRVRQVLLNLQLRLRERYVLVSLREEQLASVIADCAGPLRASAASLLQLQGQEAASPKLALESMAHASGDASYEQALHHMSHARESGQLPAGVGAGVLLDLIRLSEYLHRHAQQLA